MKKITLAIVAIGALIGTPALAADMAVKAPPLPVPAWSWNGWYIGGNFGGSWTSGGVGESCTSGAGISTGCSIVPDSGLNSSGIFGGGQIGYNWQVGQGLAGIEADIQGGNIRGSSSVTGAFPTVGGGTSPTETYTASQSINWFGTVRARVGILATNNALWYVTGGLIYGEVKTAQNAVYTTGVSFPATSDNLQVGGTVGGGVEWAFSPSWSVKVEGLFYNLGNVTTAATQVPTPSVFTDFKTFGFQGVIARVGLNWHFGGAPAP